MEKQFYQINHRSPFHFDNMEDHKKQHEFETISYGTELPINKSQEFVEQVKH
ncbi:MAG: hypothetical protein ACOYVK_03230 [Bacillota bacterium]